MKYLLSAKRTRHPVWSIWIIGSALLALGYLLVPIWSMFLYAAIIAYIAHPAVRGLNRRGISADWSALLVLVLLTLVMLTLGLVAIPLFIQQVSALFDTLPKWITWVQTHLEPILRRFSVDIAFDTKQLKPQLAEWVANHTQTAETVLPDLVAHIGNKSMALVDFIANAVLFPWIVFYFLRNGESFVRTCLDLVPRRYIDKVLEITTGIHGKLEAFLHGELLVMLVMSLLYSVAMAIIGLHYSLAIGVIAGLLTCIPYLGTGLGLLLSTSAALLQFNTLTPLWYVWGIFIAGHLLQTNIITSKLVSERMGLPPMLEIFALLVFSELFGFVGLLLALPLGAVLQVGYRHLIHYYLASPLYRKQARHRKWL